MPKILVTAALPYANGPAHLGHILEHIQTDIYVRYLRSSGQDAVFLCADDTHGTPIEVAARKEGIAPEEFIGRWATEHQKTFKDFGINHVYYGSTHTPENEKFARIVFERLAGGGHVEKRSVEQYYCEKDARFLPDRFIKGTCPNPTCKAPDQYGDVCEVCGKTYTPRDLIEPRCAICGTPPVLRSSDHYFVKLGQFTEFLRGWTSSGTLDPSVRNGLQPWFEIGLADWDVSRDGPYFGFKIPGETDKYFYVWLDAPIGYISNTERWCGNALEYWAYDADAEIVHVIGKDIVYFHTLFWPAMLYASGYKLPKRVQVHGMLTFNGEKMSKSRGTALTARDYLDVLDPMYLRYFFASNLGPAPEDIDLALEEFRNRVNADLVNNFGNLANRALKLLAASFGGKLSAEHEPPGMTLAFARSQAVAAGAFYEKFQTRDAVRTIREISDWANKYLADRAPWNAIKTGDGTKLAQAHRDLSFAAEVAYILAALLEPVVPTFSAGLFTQLNAAPLTIKQVVTTSGPLLAAGHVIGTPSPLAPRLEAAQVAALIKTAATPPVEKPMAPAKPPAGKEPAGPPPVIAYDDFAKLDLRVGKVLSCAKVEKADKLLQFQIDLGEPQPRLIVSGIAAFYKPEELVGRQVVVVANLAPREFKKQGLTSHGMILSASSGTGAEARLRLVEPPAEAAPGAKVS